MKKVLLVSNPHCGGAERVTVLLGKILHDRGYDIELLIYKQCESESCDILSFIPEYFTVSTITCRYRFLLIRLYAYLKSNSCDYVFSSLPMINHIIIILVKLFFRRRKVVIRECNTPSRHPKRIQALNKILYRYADGVISQTEEMKDEMMSVYKLPQDLITTIVNPIDVDLIREMIKERYLFPSESVVYVAVGRVQPQKGYDILIKAFSKVVKEQPSSILYIVGNDSGKYAEQQKELVLELELNNNVVFTGFQENPYKYMVEADCYVLSSWYEGLPNTLLDAVYLNLPIVATSSIPYIPKLLGRYSKGKCVPVGDIDQLAVSMIDLVKSGVGDFESYENILCNNVTSLFQIFG